MLKHCLAGLPNLGREMVMLLECVARQNKGRKAGALFFALAREEKDLRDDVGY